MNGINKRLSLTLSAVLLALAPLSAVAQEVSPPSIDTPAAISKLALARVKEQRRGQYAYPAGFKSDYVESNGIKLHYVSAGSGSVVTRPESICWHAPGHCHRFARTWAIGSLPDWV